MEITKREIIASIVIISILLIIGFFISESITNSQNDKDSEYIKATHIEDQELFQYGMDTNIGNTFVYGDLIAVDTVSYPEIEGEYMHVEKIKEKYTRHTRTVTKTKTVNGKTKTYTETKVYWSWDMVNSEDKTCKEITFCGITFPTSKIQIPSAECIDSIKESSHIRYKYYGTPVKHTGTIYAYLSDGTIPVNTEFHENMSIDELLNQYTSHVGNIVFWIVWIIFIAFVVYGFYYLENNWLE
mgnify:FL=1